MRTDQREEKTQRGDTAAAQRVGAELSTRDGGDGLDTFVRLARVKKLTDSSKSTIWRWIKAGRFPSPVIHDGLTVMWSLAEIAQWQLDKKRVAHQQRATKVK